MGTRALGDDKEYDYEYDNGNEEMRNNQQRWRISQTNSSLYQKSFSFRSQHPSTLPLLTSQGSFCALLTTSWEL